MSRKRGLSVDEKRARIEKIFYDTKDVFTLQQLEAIASKKGVVRQTVKDIAQSLVDDGFLCLDKIGTSNFYWQFPSQSLVLKQNSKRKWTEMCDDLRTKIKALEKEQSSLKKRRVESDERATSLKKLSELQKENDSLKAQLERYEANDPKLLEEIEKGIKIAFEAGNRWTDNIFNIRSYCTNKLQVVSCFFASAG